LSVDIVIGRGTWFQLRGLFQFGNGVGEIFLGEQGFSGRIELSRNAKFLPRAFEI
jgi:hypothetical protein